MATVIIGAGIIGTSTAYYLSQPQSSVDPHSVHLIESSPELFASASGYAAGFLARDWFSASVSSLGAFSFDLHKQLAEEDDGAEQWGYSQSTSTSFEESVGEHGEDWLSEGVSRSVAAKHSSAGAEYGDDRPAWLRGKGDLDVISSGDSTAQIDPLRLCQHLMAKVQSRGFTLHHPARVVSVARSSSGSLEHVRIQQLAGPADSSTKSELTLPCTRLVLAAGAWTPKVFTTLFPGSRLKIPVTSLAGHSLLLRSPHWPPPDEVSPTPASGAPAPKAKLSPCHAIFTTDSSGYSPELFSRSPGHIYIAGLNSASYPLPDRPTERTINPDSIAALRKTAERLLGKDLIVEREGVCWRPVTRKGVPILADLSTCKNGEQGVLVAAGHGAWGISLSLGTGYVMARMVEDKKDLGVEIRGLGL